MPNLEYNYTDNQLDIISAGQTTVNTLFSDGDH